MKFTVALFVLILTALTSFTGEKLDSKAIWQFSNPFFAVSNLPYQAPQFDKIKDADFKPALEEDMKHQLAKMMKIAGNPAAPTFKIRLLKWKNEGGF